MKFLFLIPIKPFHESCTGVERFFNLFVEKIKFIYETEDNPPPVEEIKLLFLSNPSVLSRDNFWSYIVRNRIEGYEDFLDLPMPFSVKVVDGYESYGGAVSRNILDWPRLDSLVYDFVVLLDLNKDLFKDHTLLHILRDSQKDTITVFSRFIAGAECTSPIYRTMGRRIINFLFNIFVADTFLDDDCVHTSDVTHAVKVYPVSILERFSLSKLGLWYDSFYGKTPFETQLILAAILFPLASKVQEIPTTYTASSSTLKLGTIIKVLRSFPNLIKLANTIWTCVNKYEQFIPRNS